MKICDKTSERCATFNIRNNGNDREANPSNVSSGKKRRNYIYIGFVFTIFAILATAYLAMMVSGSFLPFNVLDGITNHLPFYDNVHNEAEFKGYSGREIILLCCSWGEELADGEITFFIGDHMIDEGSNGNRYEVDRSSVEAVTKAFGEWDSKIEGLRCSFTR